MKENDMGKKRKRELATLSDQLRQVIQDSGLSRYQICKLTGMDPSHLHRFVHGTGRLTNDTIDRIGDALRLRLVVDQD
jgi:transcriptional regulator with XRE-family HTH domain